MYGNPDAILTADIHIRGDKPLCRTDDFLTAQFLKWKFIDNLATQYNCPVLIAGDLGQKPQWPNWLLTQYIEATKAMVIMVPGQHDLPNHRLIKWDKSGIGVLWAAHTIKILLMNYQLNNQITVHGFPYGEPIKRIRTAKGYKQIALAHMMVIEHEKSWPGQEAYKAHALLKKFPCYDLIVTGDNHLSFVSKYEGRLLVNPGSMMRTTAAQADHKPRVYLWYAEENKVQPVFLPVKKDVVDRTHIDVKQNHDERMTAYVTHLKTGYEITLAFKKNMKEHLNVNRTRKPVKEKIWAAIP